jgi:very-short-patch-repair endonuclease
MMDQNAPIRKKSHRLSPVLLSYAKLMRASSVPAERILWKCLCGRKLCGLKFRRQVPIGKYIADFYCAEQRLILELDGPSHDGRERYDMERNEWLGARELSVLRFGNAQVHEDLEGVLTTIAEACGAL